MRGGRVRYAAEVRGERGRPASVLRVAQAAGANEHCEPVLQASRM